MIAELRSGDEAREGMAAFFENQKPKWAKQGILPLWIEPAVVLLGVNP